MFLVLASVLVLVVLAKAAGSMAVVLMPAVLALVFIARLAGDGGHTRQAVLDRMLAGTDWTRTAKIPARDYRGFDFALREPFHLRDGADLLELVEYRHRGVVVCASFHYLRARTTRSSPAYSADVVVIRLPRAFPSFQVRPRPQERWTNQRGTSSWSFDDPVLASSSAATRVMDAYERSGPLPGTAAWVHDDQLVVWRQVRGGLDQRSAHLRAALAFATAMIRLSSGAGFRV